ncbi:MAG: hypothetical protein J0I84_08885 [Terrimonas sp.]|nr:hypothetical protein [Terrimonas sp.]OJY80730.1 MAG: hypothetical protein BGP13_00045 [Sphingobacteriales bacterium 40-81]
MGSKTKPDRNKKDSVIIREPIAQNTGGGRARQDQIADICEISFHVKLKESPLAKKDVPVTLKKFGHYYHILVMASVIGRLSTKQSEMVETCARLGVRYAGKIIKEPNGMYARFTRIIQ